MMQRQEVYTMNMSKRLVNSENSGFLFVLPALLYMACFVGYPIISNIILSFQDVTVYTLLSDVKPFLGFENYAQLINKSL
jgi:multiple sugar transport system permease protein